MTFGFLMKNEEEFLFKLLHTLNFQFACRIEHQNYKTRSTVYGTYLVEKEIGDSGFSNGSSLINDLEIFSHNWNKL